MNLLLVDDDEEREYKNWTECLKTIKKDAKEKYNIQLFYSKTVDNANFLIKENDIDFLILDLRLEKISEFPNGNDLIKSLLQYGIRIPTIVVTGNPDDIEFEDLVIRRFKKSEYDVASLLDFIISVYDTGISDILKKDGFLERNLNRFYKELFIPNVNKWLQRKDSNKEQVKRSLLKIALNNLNSLLDYEEDEAYGEQFYLYFLSDDNLHTGSIYKNKESETYFLVVSPACDIFPRKQKDGSMKRNVDRIHLLPILENPEEMNARNKNAFKTNTKNRFHYLPKIDTFDGGFVDFADITVCNEAALQQDYEICDLRIADSFMKNISSRFATYFSRQGQPDLCNEEKDESKN